MASSEDFQPTHEELQRIGRAMQDPEFRRLLSEYVEEISDPKNKERYEAELRQLEAEQGNDVKFVNPEPGYVLKTVLSSNGRKVFVNICQSDVLEEPSSRKATQDGHSGVVWSIPHSVTAHREDVDKKGEICFVYDVVFHPKALRLAGVDTRFKQLVEQTALQGIEQRFPQHRLDRNVMKRPKMSYKGMPSKSVLRNPAATASTSSKTPSASANASTSSGSDTSDLDALIREKLSLEKKATVAAAAQISTPKQPPSNDSTSTSGVGASSDHFPYQIIHRGQVDISSFTNDPTSKAASMRPKELDVVFTIPSGISAGDLDLDVAEKEVCLSYSEKQLTTTVVLPFPVNQDKGSAKLDKKRHQLRVTVPVQPLASEDITHPLSKAAAAESNATSNNSGAKHNPSAQPLSRSDAAASQEPASAMDAAGANMQEPLKHNEMEATGTDIAEGSEQSAMSTSFSASQLADRLRLSQTESTLSIVIDVAGVIDAPVNLKTVDFHGLELHALCLNLILQDKAQVPICLRFDAAIDTSQAIEPSISPDNVVVVVRKAEPMAWHRVCVGADPATATKQLLLATEAVLASALQNLEDPWTGSTPTENVPSNRQARAGKVAVTASSPSSSKATARTSARAAHSADTSLTEDEAIAAQERRSSSKTEALSERRMEVIASSESVDVEDVPGDVSSSEPSNTEQQRQHQTVAEANAQPTGSLLLTNSLLFDLGDY